MVVQWSAVSPHSERVVGFFLCEVCTFSLCLRVQSKDEHIRLIGEIKLWKVWLSLGRVDLLSALASLEPASCPRCHPISLWDSWYLLRHSITRLQVELNYKWMDWNIKMLPREAAGFNFAHRLFQENVFGCSQDSLPVSWEESGKHLRPSRLQRLQQKSQQDRLLLKRLALMLSNLNFITWG